MRRRNVRLGWALELAQLGLESWMGHRPSHGQLAAGGLAVMPEAHRMTMEKAAAMLEAQAAMGDGSGNPQQPASNRAQGDRAIPSA